jgi:hypothetical protein
MRTIAALCLALAFPLPACLTSTETKAVVENSAVTLGHALEAVREVYLAACPTRDDDAGPAPQSPQCAKARDAFNAAEREYMKVNDSL